MPPGRLAARRIAYEISMRAQRDKQRASNAAKSASEPSENDWVGKVASLTEKDPSKLPLEQIKPLLVVLMHFLILAPSKEQETQLKNYIQRLHTQLASKLTGPTGPIEPG
jgi:hypothetical protein